MQSYRARGVSWCVHHYKPSLPKIKFLPIFQGLNICRFSLIVPGLPPSRLGHNFFWCDPAGGQELVATPDIISFQGVDVDQRELVRSTSVVKMQMGENYIQRLFWFCSQPRRLEKSGQAMDPNSRVYQQIPVSTLHKEY